MLKIFITLIFCLSLLSLSYSYTVAKEIIPPEKIRSIIKQAELIKEKTKPFLYYEIFNKNTLIGYVYNTIDVVPDKQGYGGAIEILVGIDKKATIQNIKILKHNETEGYASKITNKSFLGQFKGKSQSDKLIVGEDIDGITGATISSQAVADILKQSLTKVKAVIEGNRPEIEEQAGSKRLTELKNLGLDPKEAEYYKAIE